MVVLFYGNCFFVAQTWTPKEKYLLWKSRKAEFWPKNNLKMMIIEMKEVGALKLSLKTVFQPLLSSKRLSLRVKEKFHKSSSQRLDFDIQKKVSIDFHGVGFKKLSSHGCGQALPARKKVRRG